MFRGGDMNAEGVARLEVLAAVRAYEPRVAYMSRLNMVPNTGSTKGTQNLGFF